MNHLQSGFADQLDDLSSLVFLAYKFVYKELPWEKLEQVQSDPLFLNSDEFAEIRK